MRATKVEQQQLIAKGMFLLGGHLTTTRYVTKWSATDDAAPMVQEIEAALRKNGINPDDIHGVFE